MAGASTYTLLAGMQIVAATPATPACIAPPSGLVSWWRAEGNASDSGDGNSGTLAGNTTYGAGRVGQGFVFDGNRDLVTVGNPTNLQLQNFTIEAWIKRASASAVSYGSYGNGIIFCYGSGGYGLYLDSNGRPALSKIGLSETKPATNIADTNFHHLAVTKSGSTVVFYIDGVSYSAPAYDPGFVFSTVAAIGARGDNLDNSFLGTIDEPAVYNRALSAAEIGFLYDAGVTGKCKQPPAILTQPASQRVTVGLNATFSVEATGTPQLRYQWRFNGDDLAGATSSTFSFVVGEASGGLYSVRVTNAFGAVISSNALLVVNHPPLADAGATKPGFIVPAGCSPTVVLDGSRSSDSDADPLQYRWFKTGETNAFATGVVAVVSLPLGTHSVTLIVDDSLATDAQTFTVELITPAQVVERLIALVSSQAQKPHPLVATLSAALASIERGNYTAAINQLEAFQNKVRAQVTPGDPALAGQFIQAAQEIVGALNRDCASAKPHGKIGKVHRHGDARVKVEFSAPDGWVYLVEASTNLVDWEKIGVAIQSRPGEFEFEDPGDVRLPTRFYRIVDE